ncbi:MAG: 23S rRNA (uracil(1939)-C(5))-methyltransferase RlmD [Clostridia bacterium]|nr:23S rRNA (uracil(1939)-C(5))-methyltransferase RlmD [Clostridia bacterium]
MKKNDDIVLEIKALSGQGVGIGRYNGIAVFVDQTAVGDTVKAHIIKVKKNYCVGKLMEIVTPSPDRKAVDCPAFSRCGGCSFRHINYEKELEIKAQGVYDAMKRIGSIDMEPKDITPSPRLAGYRNKAQYPISMGDDGIFYGFFAKHSHRVIKSEGCLLQPPVFEKTMQEIKIWADKNKITAYDETIGKGVLRHILLRLGEKTGELMVVAVINADTLPFADDLAKMLSERLGDTLKSLQYNINKEDTNVILGEKTVLVYGDDTITDEICGVKVKISAASFYQVNRDAAEVLYKKAATYIEDGDNVIVDLFCGIGTIGLSVLNLCGREGRTLVGVEIVPSAIENAKQNALLGGFKNTEFILGDATAAAEKLSFRNISPDVVIVDPPRKGCDEKLLKIIAEDFAPKKLIYISCDPATLARDSKILSENGYKLQEYSPVDLFPATAHIETVALFHRQKD